MRITLYSNVNILSLLSLTYALKIGTQDVSFSMDRPPTLSGHNPRLTLKPLLKYGLFPSTALFNVLSRNSCATALLALCQALLIVDDKVAVKPRAHSNLSSDCQVVFDSNPFPLEVAGEATVDNKLMLTCCAQLNLPSTPPSTLK